MLVKLHHDETLYEHNPNNKTIYDDLTGEPFGRLTVIEKENPNEENNGTTRWVCKCVCGNVVAYTAKTLIRDLRKSCGCYKGRSIGDTNGKLTIIGNTDNNKELHDPNSEFSYICKCTCGEIVEIPYRAFPNRTTCGKCLNYEKHGDTNSEYSYLYSRYRNMIARCYNPNSTEYHNYGGRGIKICDEWLEHNNGYSNFKSWAISAGCSPELSIDRINNDGNYEPSNCRWVTNQVQANNKRTNIYYGDKNVEDWVRERCINRSSIYRKTQTTENESELLEWLMHLPYRVYSNPKTGEVGILVLKTGYPEKFIPFTQSNNKH